MPLESMVFVQKRSSQELQQQGDKVIRIFTTNALAPLFFLPFSACVLCFYLQCVLLFLCSLSPLYPSVCSVSCTLAFLFPSVCMYSSSCFQVFVSTLVFLFPSVYVPFSSSVLIQKENSLFFFFFCLISFLKVQIPIRR